MMLLPRFLIPALAAAFVGACGMAPANNAGSAKLAVADAPAPSSSATATPQNASVLQAAAIEKAAQSYTAMADPKSKAYKIGPLDVLDITVYKAPDLSKSVQVSEAGTINYPLIGEMTAGGKSARELEQELTKKLGAKFLQNPQITVFVKEYNSQRVTVTGSVKKPGVVPIAGGMTLQQAIAQSGGFDEFADSTVVLFRVTDGKHLAGRYDVSEIQAGREDDPQLQSGDVIVVSNSDAKVGANYAFKLLPLANIAPLL
ncbi:MAG: polysaccharide biosynthesis/export family protein [Rhodomicrobium sp.]